MYHFFKSLCAGVFDLSGVYCALIRRREESGQIAAYLVPEATGGVCAQPAGSFRTPFSVPLIYL